MNNYCNWGTLSCRMCGDESTSCMEYASIHAEAQVCSKCANIVANVYSMQHSGQYLTWPNDVIPPRYRPRKTISITTRTMVMERDKYRCIKCQSHRELQLDHIYPHIKGGSDNPENLQTMCGPCNRIKKDKVEATA